ncbi:uncharacterized protein [Vulpes vulpes]|uniref:Uncharacterized protein isoform X2 n=1 Tax=Vulpes vulpes TaxID=9627 RepID=A0ABM4Y4D4_VULVU
MQKPFRNRFLKEMNHAVARPAQPFGEGPPASALLPWRVHGSPDCGPRTEGRNHPSLAGNLIPGRCSLSDDPGPAGGPHSYGHSSFTYTDLHLFFQECLTGCPLQIHQMCHLFHHVVISGIIIEHPSPPLWSMDGCSLLSIPPNVLNTVRRGKRLMLQGCIAVGTPSFPGYLSCSCGVPRLGLAEAGAAVGAVQKKHLLWSSDRGPSQLEERVKLQKTQGGTDREDAKDRGRGVRHPVPGGPLQGEGSNSPCRRHPARAAPRDESGGEREPSQDVVAFYLSGAEDG